MNITVAPSERLAITEVNMTLDQLLNSMWADYTAFNPRAKKIFDLLTENGDTVLNDHIALRTYNHPKMDLEKLAEPFLKLGYKFGGDYHFKEKKLYAKHYEHPDMKNPKIFISHLLVEQLSPGAQKIINGLIEQVPADVNKKENFLFSGRPWKSTHAQFTELAKESEYAAWMSAHGFRPNHFTVNVNALRKFPDLPTLNAFLQKNGYVLNASGGVIKGSPEAFLEQSSTMAEEAEVKFEDGTHRVPACYYEFAKRYPMANGQLYQGFVEKSADKIFESTNKVK